MSSSRVRPNTVGYFGTPPTKVIALIRLSFPRIPLCSFPLYSCLFRGDFYYLAHPSHINTHTRTHTHTHIHTHTRARTHTRTHAHTYRCNCDCASGSRYHVMCVSVCVRACVRVCMSVCVCVLCFQRCRPGNPGHASASLDPHPLMARQEKQTFKAAADWQGQSGRPTQLLP